MSPLKIKRESIKTFKALLVLFTIIGLTTAGLLFLFGKLSIQTTDLQFYPSNPYNWTEQDTSIKLHGRFYYPIGFDSSRSYPSVIMFHGRGRTLEDNDYFARKLATMGIFIFSISFRGHGISEGEFDVSSTNANITYGDGLGAYRYLIEQSFVENSKIMAHGTSMGGGVSVFLALNNLTSAFIVWYPALGYIWGNSPLYTHNITKEDYKGYIIAGTADECGSCLPVYNQEFIENNPFVGINWLEGATHTDNRFFFQCVDLSTQYISELWSISPSNWLQDIYINGILAAIIAGIIIIIDIIWIIIHKIKKKTKRNEDRTSFSNQ